MKLQIKELQISGMFCRLYLPSDYQEGEKRYPVIYVNGEIPFEEMLPKLGEKDGGTDFLLLSVKPANWNDDFTPWAAPAFRKGEEAPAGGADVYLSCLTKEIKPYMDRHYRTKPEPEHTALFGYSLGGLTAVYSVYKTDVFGAVASLSGSLWYDDFCEFMERERPLRTNLQVYLSLGKKESRSKNPRMRRVAECTESAAEILRGQLKAAGNQENGADKRTGDVYFEWNEGNHFHDIAGRFTKAVMWWAEKTQEFF